MGWRDLLQTEDEAVVLPWVGGRSLRTFDRSWRLTGRLPAEHGWYRFQVHGRKATLQEPAEAPPGVLRQQVKGYLVGDRLVPEQADVPHKPDELAEAAEQVFLIEPGLDRFVYVAAGRCCDDGPLIYEGQEFPLGPEDEVMTAFLDDKKSVDHVAGVSPALDGAFRFERWRRQEAEKRRREEERRRREEQERLEREERQRRIRERLGDAVGRREMAQLDFEEGARAALAMGGAEYLDHRQSYHRGEMVVRFRFNRRRFECVCATQTLRIIDAGICLVDHGTNEKGDTWLTLESLPGVIQQAQREGKLVVFRHVD